MDEVNACIAANAEMEELVDKPEVVNGVFESAGRLPSRAFVQRSCRSATRGLFDTQAERVRATTVLQRLGRRAERPEPIFAR